MIANYWLRPGNTSASTNYLSFLEDTLSRLQDKRVGLIRMDSGFFSGNILGYLEQRQLSYIIACRLNNRIKYSLTHEKTWVEVADGLEIAETTYQAEHWDSPKRIVMVRQEVKKRPKAAGKQVRELELLRMSRISGNTDTAASSRILHCLPRLYMTRTGAGPTPRTGSRSSSTISR